MCRVIYFEDIQSGIPTPRSRFEKRIAQYNASGSAKFSLANRQIPLLARQNCFILHSSFVRGPSLYSDRRACPLNGRSAIAPPSITIHPTVDKNKRKLFVKLCFHRLVFPNRKVGKKALFFFFF